MKKIMSELLGISEKSYYRWKKETHIQLIDLIEKHFDENDLIEFLKTGKISKFEMDISNNNEMNDFFLKNAIHKIKTSAKKDKVDVRAWEVKTKSNKKIPQYFIDFFKDMLEGIFLQFKGKRYLPLQTFLEILNQNDLDTLAYFMKNKNLENIEVKIEIINDFVKNELSKLEVEQLIENKNKVIEFFHKEKEHNSFLNWR